jgi:hypothetical protein
MATLKSTQVTNLDAVPLVREPSHRDSGMLQESTSAIVTAAAQPAADILHMVKVPSNARVSQVLLSNPTAAVAGAVDCGLYTKGVDGTYTVVDADFFASAQALTAALVNSDITHESGVYTTANTEKALWEALGLTADPKIDYFISLTITTTFNTGPTSLALKVRWSK